MSGKEMIDRLEPPFVDLWAADWTAADAYEMQPTARRFETFERNVAGQIGLMEAIRYARAIGLPQIEARITSLAEDLRQRLVQVPGVRIHDTGARRCGIVTFTLDGEAAAQTALRLKRAGVMVSVTPRAYARIDFEARGLDAVVRASLHCFNDTGDLDRLVAAVAGETLAEQGSDMPNDFGGKVALVTRRAGGIGTAIARRLARAGARVATGRSRDPEGTPLLVDAPTTRALAHSRPDAGQEGSRLVRIWETKFDLARRDELVAYANEISLPVLRNRPGCTGVMFFTREDWWITQTIWRDHKSIVHSRSMSPTAELSRASLR